MEDDDVAAVTTPEQFKAGLLLVGGIGALPGAVALLLDRLLPVVGRHPLPLLAIERAHSVTVDQRVESRAHLHECHVDASLIELDVEAGEHLRRAHVDELVGGVWGSSPGSVRQNEAQPRGFFLIGSRQFLARFSGARRARSAY